MDLLQTNRTFCRIFLLSPVIVTFSARQHKYCGLIHLLSPVIHGLTPPRPISRGPKAPLLSPVIYMDKLYPSPQTNRHRVPCCHLVFMDLLHPSPSVDKPCYPVVTCHLWTYSTCFERAESQTSCCHLSFMDLLHQIVRKSLCRLGILCFLCLRFPFAYFFCIDFDAEFCGLVFQHFGYLEPIPPGSISSPWRLTCCE